MRCRRPTRGAGLLALTLLVPLVTGCAAASQSWRGGPAGIPVERQLRDQLSAGDAEGAYEALSNKKVAPADLLLRHMYRGAIGVQAGEFDAAARSMDRAWEVVWERWTKRFGDMATSMVTGDAALPYDPGPAEHMFIPYYGAMAWLARNERISAAVEARRLSALLATEAGPQPPDEFKGVMRYVAGVMYEVAGERNDADVSYRNAAALLDNDLPGDTIPPDMLHGDVVVFLEDGFVSRPEPQSILFWFNDDEFAALSSDNPDDQMRAVHSINRRRELSGNWGLMGLRSVRLSWPAMPSPAYRHQADLSARAWVGDESHLAQTVTASVSDAVRADFDRNQPARLGRAIARAALREATLKGAGNAFEKAVEGSDDKSDEGKKGNGGWKTAGGILAGIGLLAVHASSSILDQPDLRGWQVLPDRIAVARMRLPTGTHSIEVMRGNDAVSIGTVNVYPGSVTVLRHRFFGELSNYLSYGQNVLNTGN